MIKDNVKFYYLSPNQTALYSIHMSLSVEILNLNL